MCQISFGEAHSDKCNQRYGKPTYSADVIKFYNKGEPFFEFTNFYDVPITIGTVKYTTSEHYYQSQKFTHMPNIQAQILAVPTPKNAYDIAHANVANIRPGWDAIKVNVMYDALKAKFTQHVDLKEMLKSTGSSRLIEHSPTDKFWGDGGDGTGQNQLGRLLMKLRDEFNANPQTGGCDDCECDDMRPQTGGKDCKCDDAKKKYLKYKNKYLALKQNTK
jgi:hypothetical protein